MSNYTDTFRKPAMTDETGIAIAEKLSGDTASEYKVNTSAEYRKAPMSDETAREILAKIDGGGSGGKNILHLHLENNVAFPLNKPTMNHTDLNAKVKDMRSLFSQYDKIFCDIDIYDEAEGREVVYTVSYELLPMYSFDRYEDDDTYYRTNEIIGLNGGTSFMSYKEYYFVSAFTQFFFDDQSEESVPYAVRTVQSFD